jgi:Endonuclease-reverse transcriptase
MMNNCNSTSIEILQLNQDKRFIASTHLFNALNQPIPQFQIALLQEPKLLDIPSDFHVFPPKNFIKKPRAAILCHNSLKGAFIAPYSSRDICMVRLTIGNQNIILISCYIHKNTPIEHFTASLPMETLKNCIIAVDTNASSQKWGGRKSCPRGKLLEEWLAQNDLYTANVLPHNPSFQNKNGSSFIDTTITSASLLTRIQNWSVCNQSAFCSGHLAFKFKLGSSALTNKTFHPFYNPTTFSIHKKYSHKPIF